MDTPGESTAMKGAGRAMLLLWSAVKLNALKVIDVILSARMYNPLITSILVLRIRRCGFSGAGNA